MNMRKPVIRTRIKTIFYSTAPIREILLRKALDVFGPVFIQQYGSTEGSSISNLTKITTSAGRNSRPAAPVIIGRPGL